MKDENQSINYQYTDLPLHGLRSCARPDTFELPYSPELTLRFTFLNTTKSPVVVE
jgi:hypothetical protein